MMKRPGAVIPLLMFGSGLSALLYQTAWEHMLRLAFGASTAASSAVLAIFLGGLGLGGALLGRRAERSPRPLVFYGNLEAGVALSAALTPLSVGLIAHVYFALGGRDALGPVGATMVRLLLAALVLGPSVVLMGGTLPAAARALESDTDVARDKVALLYAANTAGAVLGALLGTFVLFELFGTRLALWSATIVNLLVAVLARAYGRTLPELEAPAKAEAAEERRESGAESLQKRVVYGAAALVGFSFLGLEIVWYRMLGPVLGGSSFTFGLILATALGGIGLGGYLYSRRSEDRRATLGLLATTVALEAACAAFPLALGDGVALLSGMLRPLAAIGFASVTLGWAAIAALVVFPAAAVSGYQFPVLIALLGEGRKNVARQIGFTYAFNTLGSIVGAIAVGFVLLPSLGLLTTFRLLSGVLAVLGFGVSLVALSAERRARGVVPALVFCAVAGLMLRAQGPTAVGRHTPIGAGRVQLHLDKNSLRSWETGVRASLLWEKDGVESSVGVIAIDGVAFLVNGKSDGAVVNDRATQGMLGLIPALIHPAPKRAFVLGLGTGMSAGWLASVPGVERVDVAELEPAVLGVARECKLANQDVLARPNVHVFVGDGREFLLTHPDKYDIIVSEPSNPYRAGIASLFTREFYEAVRAHLAQGGLFGQWVQGYEIDSQTLRIVLATLTSVFPHVDAWQTEGGDFLFVAGMTPHPIDVALLRRRVAEEPYRTVLPRVGLIADAEGVLGRFVAREELVKNVATALGTPANTDDTTLLDYAFARNVGTNVGMTLPLELMQAARSRNLARPDVAGDVDWSRVDEERARAWIVTGQDPLALPSEPTSRARVSVVDEACTGDLRTAMRRYKAHPFEPRDPIELFAVGKVLALGKDAGALDRALELERAGFVAEAHLVRARYRLAMRDRAPAVHELVAAVNELRKTALPLCRSAQEVVELLPAASADSPELAAEAARALMQGPLAVYEQEQRRVQVAQELAYASRDISLCVAALGKQLDTPWWSEGFLRERADCLSRAHHPLAAKAQDDLVEFLSSSVGQIEAGLALPPVQSPPSQVSGTGGDSGVDLGLEDQPAATDAGDATDAAPSPRDAGEN